MRWGSARSLLISWEERHWYRWFARRQGWLIRSVDPEAGHDLWRSRRPRPRAGGCGSCPQLSGLQGEPSAMEGSGALLLMIGKRCRSLPWGKPRRHQFSRRGAHCQIDWQVGLYGVIELPEKPSVKRTATSARFKRRSQLRGRLPKGDAPDPRLARWGLVICCQIDPRHPAVPFRAAYVPACGIIQNPVGRVCLRAGFQSV